MGQASHKSPPVPGTHMPDGRGIRGSKAGGWVRFLDKRAACRRMCPPALPGRRRPLPGLHNPVYTNRSRVLCFGARARNDTHGVHTVRASAHTCRHTCTNAHAHTRKNTHARKQMSAAITCAICHACGARHERGGTGWALLAWRLWHARVAALRILAQGTGTAG